MRLQQPHTRKQAKEATDNDEHNNNREFWAEQKDLKTLRTCVSSFFDMVAVANEAVEHFDLCPPAAQQ